MFSILTTTNVAYCVDIVAYSSFSPIDVRGAGGGTVFWPKQQRRRQLPFIAEHVVDCRLGWRFVDVRSEKRQARKEIKEGGVKSKKRKAPSTLIVSRRRKKRSSCLATTVYTLCEDEEARWRRSLPSTKFYQTYSADILTQPLTRRFLSCSVGSSRSSQIK